MIILLTILSLLFVGASVIALRLSQIAASRKSDCLLTEQSAKHLGEQLQIEKENNISAQKTIDDMRGKLSSLQSELARCMEQNAALARELESERNETEKRFKAIAEQILKETSKEMKSTGEQRIGEILSPLAKNIEEFKRAMDSNFRNEAEGRAMLKAHIESLRDLNQSIGKEARELSVALRGNSKIQGDWGEMILTTLLEKSGLKEGLHYTVQQTRDDDNNALRNDDGNLIRPDVVIRYPDGKKVIIDSKVSLKAFTALANAENDIERKQYSEQHLRSVRKHIDELSAKDYPKAVGDSTADFVLMFIPHEPAYIAAMESDNNLWEYAYSKRVVIVSPTHLLSVLRLLSQIWQQDKINRNTLKIAEESGKMLDMLFSFKEDMDNLGKAIENAHSAHDKALRRLYTGNGNVARRASTLIELGAKAKKNLPKSWEEE